MQYHDVSKTPGRFKVAFLDPLKIAQRWFSYEPSAEDKAKLSAEEQEKKKKLKDHENKTDIIHYKSLHKFTRQKNDMCSLLFCVSLISSLNLRILFCSLLDKEPNVTLYAVTTTYASIFTSRTEECWYWNRLIFKSPDTKNSPT